MSDVHGNRHALEAVVADGATVGVDSWWVLGDLVAIGPDPVSTIELLANLPDVQLCRGNTDRYVLTADRPPPTFEDVRADPSLLEVLVAVESSFSWTRGTLAASGWLEWLKGLPLEVRTSLPDGTTVLGVHASPGRDDGPGVTPHRPEHELAAELADGCADLLFAGHTHLPTDRTVAGGRAINGGSVSNPITDDLRASYVVLSADRHGHAVEHRRVVYDSAAFLDRLRESDHPQQDYIASFQRGEQYRYPANRPGAPVLP
jgi:predicted phosphodiesterase